MTTLSQLVDDLATETGRADMRATIAEYLNQTIREVHFSSGTGGTIFFAENLQEASLVANVDGGFGWDIPNPPNFQAMAAVKYESSWDRLGANIWPKEMTPSRNLADLDNYYYRAGGRFFFAGYGGNNAIISIAWFEYPRRLIYKASGLRYAIWDAESDSWTYAPSANTPELQLAARTLSSNWLLMRWRDVLAEGVRAKIYKRLGDEVRARTCYSLYSQLRIGLQTSESADLSGYR